MATPQQIVTRALRRLKIIPAGGTPAGEDVDEGVEALTAMINSWEAEGLTGDVLPLDARFEAGVVAMLAVRVAGEYGKEPDAVLIRDAENGWSQISSAFFAVPHSRFDSALKYTGHYTDSGFILGTQPDNYGIWQPNTAYALRKTIQNGANLYECITAGTSAALGGPTGTDAEITDGTVTWCWRRVAGEPEAA